MLGRLGYAAVTFGEREFAHGPQDLRVEGAPPVVLSNVVRDGPDGPMPAGDRWRIQDVGGVRVGIFALVDPAIRIADLAPDHRILPPGPIADEAIAELEANGAEILVLLSHLERSRADSILAARPAIDVAVMGHPTTTFSGRIDPYPTITMYPGRRGQAVSIAEIGVDPEGHIAFHTSQMVELNRHILHDRDMTVLVNEAEEMLRKLGEEERERSMREYTPGSNEENHFAGAADCARCHENEHASWLDSAHAHAHQTLVDLGMSASSDCLRCHTVGFGKKTGFTIGKSEPDLSGVQCESCHGAAALHAAGPSPDGPQPTTTARAESSCVGCHDAANSPDFDLPSYLAKIRHW